MSYLSLILIQLIVVFIVDISGVVDSFKSLLSRVLTHNRLRGSDYRLKPFDCSLCSTFWCGLAYLIITHSLSLLTLTALCYLSATTPITLSIFNTIYDLFIKILDKINNSIK